MKWNNRLTELLHIAYPFIQAPMLVVTTPQMTAAVSEAGGLGSLPLGYSTAQAARERIRTVKALTQKPFAVNCFAYDPPAAGGQASETLRAYFNRYGLPFGPLPEGDPYPFYTGLLDVILEEAVPAVSFHFGLPAPAVVDRLHARGVVLLATATSVAEARQAEERGLDIVVAQGIEAGGNRGSFSHERLPEVGLVSLLPQVVGAVGLPVVAAGGLMQPKSMAAAFVLGAQGVQLGSFFLRAAESGATASWKAAVQEATDTSTVLTRAWSGRYGRGPHPRSAIAAIPYQPIERTRAGKRYSRSAIVLGRPVGAFGFWRCGSRAPAGSD